jgi:hypothetical protein
VNVLACTDGACPEFGIPCEGGGFTCRTCGAVRRSGGHVEART